MCSWSYPCAGLSTVAPCCLYFPHLYCPYPSVIIHHHNWLNLLDLQSYNRLISDSKLTYSKYMFLLFWVYSVSLPVYWMSVHSRLSVMNVLHSILCMHHILELFIVAVINSLTDVSMSCCVPAAWNIQYICRAPETFPEGHAAKSGFFFQCSITPSLFACCCVAFNYSHLMWHEVRVLTLAAPWIHKNTIHTIMRLSMKFQILWVHFLMISH